jgi:hypothetical protein
MSEQQKQTETSTNLSAEVDRLQKKLDLPPLKPEEELRLQALTKEIIKQNEILSKLQQNQLYAINDPIRKAQLDAQEADIRESIKKLAEELEPLRQRAGE